MPGRFRPKSSIASISAVNKAVKHLNFSTFVHDLSLWNLFEKTLQMNPMKLRKSHSLMKQLKTTASKLDNLWGRVY